MEIIQPPHTKISSKVKHYREIKQEAKDLRSFIKENNGKFVGKYKSGYALAHSQVSEFPKTFFVLAENKDYNLVPLFGHWCIINLEILKTEDEMNFDEACMSFPYASTKIMKRSFKVWVKYYVPSRLGLKYRGGLRKIKKSFVDLPAFICQHEVGHFKGELIYT